MRFRRTSPDTLELSELNGLGWELLRRVVPSATFDGNPAAEARLLSRPIDEPEPGFEEDWKEYVEPDLRAHFLAMQNVVTKDLGRSGSAADEEEKALRIPIRHLDSWIHALNQARLALTARYDFTELELEGSLPFSDEKRAQALFEVHFYGVLQEAFLRQADPPAA